MTWNGSQWKAIGVALTIVAMLVTAVLAYGDVRSRADEASRGIERLEIGKASREAVDAKLDAILRELSLVNERLGRMERNR